MHEEKSLTEERARTLLELNARLTDDVTQEAIAFRDKYRLLQGAFVADAALITRSPDADYLRLLSRSFSLGYLAVKNEDFFQLGNDPGMVDKLGNYGDDFTVEQAENCLKAYSAIKRESNEDDQWLSEHPIAMDILRVQALALTGLDASNVQISAGKLLSAFILGYAAAKYPERFPKPHYRDERSERVSSGPATPSSASRGCLVVLVVLCLSAAGAVAAAALLLR